MESKPHAEPPAPRPTARFVVLEHDAPQGRHWDFMLEAGGALWTWALALPPDAPGPVPAEALPDHRLAYLDYEGAVSGGRGTVTRWDAGAYAREAEGGDQVIVVLQGRRLRGRAVLTPRGPGPAAWEFRYSPVS